jgi:hypothetical protein
MFSVPQGRLAGPSLSLLLGLFYCPLDLLVEAELVILPEGCVIPLKVEYSTI